RSTRLASARASSVQEPPPVASFGGGSRRAHAPAERTPGPGLHFTPPSGKRNRRRRHVVRRCRSRTTTAREPSPLIAGARLGSRPHSIPSKNPRSGALAAPSGDVPVTAPGAQLNRL